jgi:transcriptional regulator with XRE-family HTH domain
VIGKQIRRHRLARKLSMRDLAKLVGVNGSAVAHWEAGRNDPRGELLPSLASALGVTVGELFNEAA